MAESTRHFNHRHCETKMLHSQQLFLNSREKAETQRWLPDRHKPNSVRFARRLRQPEVKHASSKQLAVRSWRFRCAARPLRVSRMPDLLQFSCTNRMLWAEHFCPLQFFFFFFGSPAE